MSTTSRREVSLLSRIVEEDLSADSQYRYVKYLGKGTFGVVVLAEDTKTRDKVAIKLWPQGANIDKNIQRELQHHSLFKHPNVIAYNRAFLTRNYVGLAMEFAQNGTLFHKVQKERGLPERISKPFFQQLLFAMDYCHKMGVANRDIKLENVLLGGDRRRPVLKLADFGYSKHDVHSAARTKCGTECYMAPEVVCGHDYQAKTADVWSFGVLLYVMLFGAYPFEESDRDYTLNIPDSPVVSEEAKKLLRAMIERNPESRITMQELYTHAWVADGLPPEFEARNNRMVEDSNKSQPPQTADEIDALLVEAGMQLPHVAALAVIPEYNVNFVGNGGAEEPEEDREM